MAKTQVSWARKKPRPKLLYTEEKGKENGKKAKRKEGEKRNSPCLGFFVFCCCFCFVFFCLLVFFIAYTLETVFTTVGQQCFALFRWKSQTGIPKIRPLKISSHLTKLRPNHEIILVWKARQDRKYRVMRREKKKNKKFKQKKFKLLAGISSFLWKLLKIFVAHAVYDKYTQLK